MKIYQCFEKPLQLYGLNYVNPSTNDYWRLTPEILKEMPQYEFLGRRCAGGRLRFKTDSRNITIRYSLKTEEVDRAMALPAAAGIDVYIGKGQDSRYAGYTAPITYGFKDKIIENTITKEHLMENVTLNLPRNEHLSHLEIGIDDDATMEAPDPYCVEKPVIFYGSSITEGGCAPRPGNAYTSIVSRWLDFDYYNYGFSGGAKGETKFAEYIAAHPSLAAFIYDYDHNAPTPEHLAQTHKPFFEIVRKAHPSIPIIMLSRPDFISNPDDSIKRRTIIYETYQDAVKAGDRNVYFVDGQQFFGLTGIEECTIDRCHPNALGFMRMAETIYPLLRQVIQP